ncbi:MAG TPA: TatD family hydrolase [Candidatus Saccharimonadales bacterium]|nr:TatD family hydrolase [Candidatus Saccharimonadales bacterium]
MEFIDSHAHPHFAELAADWPGVMARAEEAGVKRMIAVGTTLEDSQRAINFAKAKNGVWAAAGVHPHEAKKTLASKDFEANFKKLLDLSSNTENKLMAIGEIGLDYYKNHSPKEDQLKLLRRQIEIGLSYRLPFIFHVRDAFSDFWQVFDDYGGIKGVIHSFSSGRKQLDVALSRGLFVGLNGIMTFTRDQAQLEAAGRVPLDRLLLETDAPFLIPAPERGEVCEPRHVRIVAEFLASLRGEALADLAAQTTANAVSLFDLKDKS